MMKFKFRMERVLSYKQTIENHKKSQYGRAQQNLNNEEMKLNTITQYKENMKNEKNLSATKTNVGNLAMYNNYINNITIEIKSQEKIVVESLEEVEEAKKEMVHAVKEKKMFEKLRENEYEKYLYEVQKQEEKEVDTIVSYKTSTQQ